MDELDGLTLEIKVWEKGHNIIHANGSFRGMSKVIRMCVEDGNINTMRMMGE